MDNTQSTQGLGFTTAPTEEEEVVVTTTSPSPADVADMCKALNANKGKTTPASPQKEPGLPCARCNSTNTKFCYYNNYSQTQPRYFCKACRRYWIQGGSLRNVPVGGGCRKNKRHSVKNVNLPAPPLQIPTSQAYSNHSFFNIDNNDINNGDVATTGMSAMELLRSSGTQMTIPMPTLPAQPGSFFPLVDHAGTAGGNVQLFPLGDMKGGEPSVFWNGMMGGSGDHGSDHGDMKP